MTAACPNQYVTEKDKAYALKLLGAFGKVEVVPEHMIDAVVAVSGSSPAYVFMLIEAMADGAVAEGMPRAQAYEFSAQAVYGSARYGLLSGGNDDRSGPCSGAKRFPECSDRSRKGMCRGFKKFIESDPRED